MDEPDHRHYRAAMRQSAGSAAFGAALLLFFGFYYLAEPVPADLFGKSVWLMYHTLRIGGLASALIAAWLWTGHRPALAVDAVVSALIGAIFILTGTGMLVDGGAVLQVIINAFCGVLFIRAAIQSAGLFQATRAVAASTGQPASRSIDPPVVAHGATKRPPVGSGGVISPVDAADAEAPRNNAQAGLENPEPPPEGYLASLAKKRGP